MHQQLKNMKFFKKIAHYDISVGDIATVNTKDSCKLEEKACSLAIERAISLDDLIYCYNHGIWNSETLPTTVM